MFMRLPDSRELWIVRNPDPEAAVYRAAWGLDSGLKLWNESGCENRGIIATGKETLLSRQ